MAPLESIPPGLPTYEQFPPAMQYAFAFGTVVFCMVLAFVALRRYLPQSPFSGQPVNDQQFQQVTMSALKTLADEASQARDEARRAREEATRVRSTMENIAGSIQQIQVDVGIMRGWFEWSGGRKPGE